MEQDQSLLAAIREAIRGPGWAPERHATEGSMPALDGATGWLNSPPLTTESLRGRVVLVDFWTYTCINWLRTAPYLRAWADAYPGAVVLGVHTPEFPFEHDLDNVRRAVEDLDITYPVAVDSDYAIWTAFDNMYWPALYVVDAQGQIRYHHFGEGAYEESERVVRQLLAAADNSTPLPEPVHVTPQGIEVAADWADLGSAENYLGAARTERFVSPEWAPSGTPHGYTAPSRLTRNQWALAGDWAVEPEVIRLHRAGGRIVYRFKARDLNLVMAPTSVDASVRFVVHLDGRPPGADRGDDINEDGNGMLAEPRLYQLLRRRGPVGEHTFEITFHDPGVAAYAFTFG